MASMDKKKHKWRVRWRDPSGQARSKAVANPEEGRQLIETIATQRKLFPDRPFDRRLDASVFGDWTLGQIQLLFGTLAERYDGLSPQDIIEELRKK